MSITAERIYKAMSLLDTAYCDLQIYNNEECRAELVSAFRAYAALLAEAAREIE